MWLESEVDKGTAVFFTIMTLATQPNQSTPEANSLHVAPKPQPLSIETKVEPSGSVQIAPVAGDYESQQDTPEAIRKAQIEFVKRSAGAAKATVPAHQQATQLLEAIAREKPMSEVSDGPHGPTRKLPTIAQPVCVDHLSEARYDNTVPFLNDPVSLCFGEGLKNKRVVLIEPDALLVRALTTFFHQVTAPISLCHRFLDLFA
jgi:hypothetical protein